MSTFEAIGIAIFALILLVLLFAHIVESIRTVAYLRERERGAQRAKPAIPIVAHRIS